MYPFFKVSNRAGYCVYENRLCSRLQILNDTDDKVNMLSVTEHDTLFMFAGPWPTWTTMGRWTCMNFPSQWSWLNWSYRVTPSLLHCPPPWSSHPSPCPHSRLLVRNGWWLEWHVIVFFLMAWMTCTVSGHRWSLRPRPFRLVLLNLFDSNENWNLKTLLVFKKMY